MFKCYGLILSVVIGVALLVVPSVLAQDVETAWVSRYHHPEGGSDGADAIAVDDSGYVYVTGQSHSSALDLDYATIKYRPADGDTVWVRRYPGPGNGDDGACAVAVDASYNVYVTGCSDGGGTGFDYATIKYLPNGNVAPGNWPARYNGPGNSLDSAVAIAVDGSGNVYVTGASTGSGTGLDYATIKYDPNGNIAPGWPQRYNGPANGDDAACAIAVGVSGNVYVTGYSDSTGSHEDYVTIRYSPDGAVTWQKRYNGPGDTTDVAVDIAVDHFYDVYVTGKSIGDETWFDYATIKYYSYGATAWVRRYNRGEWSGDEAVGVAVDGSRNVYVTGTSDGGVANRDYVTVKYASDGTKLWDEPYDGSEWMDRASAIALDDLGNVYVTGGSLIGPGLNIDYATVKYNTDGNELWVETYTGSFPVEASQDFATAIAADGINIVYVTGMTLEAESGMDYTTIKYVPPASKVDLAVTSVFGYPRPRPGWPGGWLKKYYVRYGNYSDRSAENVVLTVELDPQVEYEDCWPANCNVDGRNVSWNLGTVSGWETGFARVWFKVPQTVPEHTWVKGIVEITGTSEDLDPTNNKRPEKEEVVTSRDPNDKEAQPWGGGDVHYIMPDQTISYTVFFENDTSATAEAIYIDVVDTLDPNLDWSTLEIGPMSHSDTCQATFDSISGVLTWHCDSIMLPPNHDPPEGEGFVSFSIKPDTGLAFGTQIKNQAYIQFDFNPWIAAPDSGPVIRTIGLPGDANADGVVNSADVVYLINYLFADGPEPEPWQAGDNNCDGVIDSADVVYLINYLFVPGSPPPGCY